MAKGKKARAATSGYPQSLLWFEDDMDAARIIARRLEEGYGLAVNGGPAARAGVFLKKLPRDRPGVLFAIVEADADLHRLVKLAEHMRPRAVVSDLEFGSNRVGGLLVLSGLGALRRSLYRALYTASADQSTRQLAHNMGVDAVFQKNPEHSALEELIAAVFPEVVVARRKDEREARSRKLAPLELENRRLRAECARLRKRAGSGGKARRPGTKAAQKGEETAKVRSLQTKLKNAEQAKEVMLAQQHDLTATLSTAAACLADVLAGPEFIPPVLKEDIERARLAAKHSWVLVESAYQLSAGASRQRPEPASIQKCFADAQDMLRSKTPESVSIDLELPPDLPASSVPGTLLLRCALNLLRNSLEAIPDRGRIRVRCATKRPAGAKRVEIVVSDNGKGIKKVDMPKLFAGGFSTKGKKHGFGLFIVKSVMDRYGGKVHVESKRGKGTSVRLTLPVA